MEFNWISCYYNLQSTNVLVLNKFFAVHLSLTISSMKSFISCSKE